MRRCDSPRVVGPGRIQAVAVPRWPLPRGSSGRGILKVFSRRPGPSLVRSRSTTPRPSLAGGRPGERHGWGPNSPVARSLTWVKPRPGLSASGGSVNVATSFGLGFDGEQSSVIVHWPSSETMLRLVLARRIELAGVGDHERRGRRQGQGVRRHGVELLGPGRGVCASPPVAHARATSVNPAGCHTARPARSSPNAVTRFLTKSS